MKKIAIFLAVLMVISSLALCACDQPGVKPAGKTSGGEKNTQGTDQTTAQPKSSEENKDLFYGYEKLPALDSVDGFELKVYSRGKESGYNAWLTVDLVAEELLDEPINDAVYTRNEILKDKYGFTIVDVPSPKDQAVQAMAEIKAGGEAFDLIIADGEKSAALGEGGYLLNLYEVPYLQLEAPWWDPHAAPNLSIGGKLYFTTGDLSISANDATWITAFNKQVQEEHNVEDLYKLVKENKWTIDKVDEITKSISSDLNDDGRFDNKDIYGYVYEPFNGYALFYSLGCSIITKDENDYPSLSVFSTESQSIFETIRQISDDDANYYQGWSGDCTSIIKDNRALLTSTTMFTVRANYRKWEQDFGILPMPKLAADQNYVDVVSTATCGSLYSIPTSSEDRVETVGYCLEALARESKETLREAYYDVALTGVLFRDNDSSEMLDIILANRYFDLAIIYNWGDWYKYFYNLWQTKASNFSSTYDSKKDMTEKAIQTTIDKYIENN